MKILFVSPEVEPFAKTGGLADVASSLPKALERLGHEVRIIMPLYKSINRKRFGIKTTDVMVSVPVGAQKLEAGLWSGTMPGSRIIVYFVEEPSLFERDGLYQENGKDYTDNLNRFSFFSQAALLALPVLKWRPDIIHCHDWQSALLLAQIKYGSFFRSQFFTPVATAFTIHNLAYQGLFPKEQWSLTQLPESAYSVDSLEFYGQINCLKGALVSAGVLTTVSPTYAREIQTHEFGCGLEGVLAKRRDELFGIVNGIDPDAWNPQTDEYIANRYSPQSPAAKGLCKMSLQESQKLPKQQVLLIGMIQRLAEQKGIDIFVQALERLMTLPLQIVILGTGDLTYHRQLEDFTKRFPDKLALNLKFDNALAHRIEAGSDAFLMPSRFEPCGLNQMYSMRYGSVPIVRMVGGLSDTVIDLTPKTFSENSATGFVFSEYSPDALFDVVKRALGAFGDNSIWTQLMLNGMRKDFSWERSAKEYVHVYERAIANKSKLAVNSASRR